MICERFLSARRGRHRQMRHFVTMFEGSAKGIQLVPKTRVGQLAALPTFTNVARLLCYRRTVRLKRLRQLLEERLNIVDAGAGHWRRSTIVELAWRRFTAGGDSAENTSSREVGGHGIVRWGSGVENDGAVETVSIRCEAAR